jgi:hypothetical protein
MRDPSFSTMKAAPWGGKSSKAPYCWHELEIAYLSVLVQHQKIRILSVTQ